MTRVAAAVIEQGGGVLICQRQKGKIFGGMWEFPGGKMRASETPRQALERELREELGAASSIGRLLQIVRHQYPKMDDAVRIWFFRATLAALPRNLVFERIVWAPRAQFPRYDFLAADRVLIARLVRGEI